MIPESKKVFFISDLHFYHTNIIKYCNRPYSDVDEMNADIIKRWNSVIHKGDVVWNLGDFAFVKKHEKDKIKELVSKLNGKQYLILGNHDRRISRNLRFWYDLGFEKVYDKPVLFQDQYILSHEPLESKHHLDLTGTQLKNIHGHIHNSNQDYYDMKDEDKPNWNSPNHKELRTIPDISKNSFNVSLEVINYTPIRFEQIVDAMNKDPIITEPSKTIPQPSKEFHIPFIQKEEQPKIVPHIIPEIPIYSDNGATIGWQIPEACKNCSNRNPDGSLKGPCLCTLGTPPVMC